MSITKKHVSEKSMETKAYVQGQTIFKVGETADHLFIIGSGVGGIYFPENWEMNKPNKILKETKKKKC